MAEIIGPANRRDKAVFANLKKLSAPGASSRGWKMGVQSPWWWK